MTEEEWLRCVVPNHLWAAALARFGPRPTRKLQLFLCAICRPLWPLVTEPSRDLFLAVERCAESGKGYSDLDERAAEAAGRRAVDDAIIYAALTVEDAWEYGLDSILKAAGHGWNERPGRYQADDQNFSRELAAQCGLLRDIVGNPFRPVAFAPEWGSDTAVSLARGMYESRDFSAMPILADALQDAGCNHADILAHCRDAAATHVRGCWVVDLVLGKE